jgi:hypothetical protein
LVTPSISNRRPFVFANPVAVGPAVDEDVFVEVEAEVLVFTDDVELVLTEDVDLEVELVVTAVEVDVFDVVVGAGATVPGTHW